MGVIEKSTYFMESDDLSLRSQHPTTAFHEFERTAVCVRDFHGAEAAHFL